MDKDLLQFIVLLLSVAVLISLTIIATVLHSQPKSKDQMTITNDEDLFDAFERLASSEVPTLRTLKETGADRLDFHEVHVRNLHDMLKKAFDLGFKHRDDGGFN
jgi:hypothetical protein